MPSAPSLPTEAPTPEPSVDPRSPKALAALLTFTSPPQDDPAVQSAIDAYEEFLRQFIIAEGLGDPAYPPLLALINTEDQVFVDSLLSGPQAADKADYYAAGPLAERVTDAAGNESRVLIDTCTDYTDRKVYKEGSDDFVEDFNFGVIRTRAVMTQAAKGWILRDISLPDEQNCE